MNERTPVPASPDEPKSFLDKKHGELTYRENLKHIERVLGNFAKAPEIDARQKLSQGWLDLSFLIWSSALLKKIEEGTRNDPSATSEELKLVTAQCAALTKQVGDILGKVRFE